MNIKTSCVTTHGSTVNYFCFGSGKTPMVMLPGISTLVTKSVISRSGKALDLYCKM